MSYKNKMYCWLYGITNILPNKTKKSFNPINCGKYDKVVPRFYQNLNLDSVFDWFWQTHITKKRITFNFGSSLGNGIKENILATTGPHQGKLNYVKSI